MEIILSQQPLQLKIETITSGNMKLIYNTFNYNSCYICHIIIFCKLIKRRKIIDNVNGIGIVVIYFLITQPSSEYVKSVASTYMHFDRYRKVLAHEKLFVISVKSS